MKSSLENKVALYRKTAEMVEDLKSAMQPLVEEMKLLEGDIFAAFSKNQSLYNVCKKKRIAMGFVGQNLVRVDFNEALSRTDGGRRDDQEWLSKLSEIEDDNFPLVNLSYELNAAHIRALLSEGSLTVDEIERKYGLTLTPTYRLKVQKLPNATELSALKDAAMALADEIEDS